MMPSPQERQIFRYHNGQKIVCADPAVLYRKLLKAAGGEKGIDEIDQAARQEDQAIAGPAFERLLAAVREAFGLKPLDEDGNGATEPEQMKAYTDFLEYLADAKKKDSSPPTWPQPMEGASSVPTTPGSSPTPIGSDSGLIAVGSSSNKQP